MPFRVYDGLTARIVLNAGFECLYMVRKLPGFRISENICDVFYLDGRWHNNVKNWNAGPRGGNFERHEEKTQE